MSQSAQWSSTRGLSRKLFSWFVVNSQCLFIRTESIMNFKPFKIMESVSDDNRKVVFKIMHDRRKHFRFMPYTTFLVEVEIHTDNEDRLKEFSKIQLLAIDVFGAFMFSNSIIGDVLLNHYLDRMLEKLSEQMSENDPDIQGIA